MEAPLPPTSPLSPAALEKRQKRYDARGPSRRALSDAPAPGPVQPPPSQLPVPSSTSTALLRLDAGLEVAPPPPRGPLSSLTRALMALRGLVAGGALRTLPPAFVDARVAAALSASASDAPGGAISGVPTAAPALGVVVLDARGPNGLDAHFLAPRVRLHAVDLSTGRYVAPSQPLLPAAGPVQMLSLPPPAGSGSGGGGGCLGTLLSGRHARARITSAPTTVCAQTGTALNSTIASHAASLFAAGHVASPLAAGNGGNLTAGGGGTPVGGSDTGGIRGGAALLWHEPLVLGVPLAEALASPTVALFFEVVQAVASGAVIGGTVSSSTSSSGGGAEEEVLAWGFLRVGAGGGGAAGSRALDLARSRIALGFPPPPGSGSEDGGGDLPGSALAAARGLSSLPVVDVQLYAVHEDGLGEWVEHMLTLPPPAPTVSATPVAAPLFGSAAADAGAASATSSAAAGGSGESGATAAAGGVAAAPEGAPPPPVAGAAGVVDGVVAPPPSSAIVVTVTTPPMAPPTASSPSVLFQWRQPRWRALPLTLRVAPFGAVIPRARFLRRHPFGTTYLTPTTPMTSSAPPNLSSTRGIGQDDSPPLAVHILASALSEHSMLGRPLQCIRLPCDAPAETPGAAIGGSTREAIAADDSSAAAAAAAAASAHSNQERDESGFGGGWVLGAVPDATLRLRRVRPRMRGDTSTPPNTLVGTLPTDALGATVVSFSPDGAFIAVACMGNAGRGATGFPIRLFEARTGCEACAPLQGHAGVVYALDWAPDACWLVSAGGDGVAVVWEIPRVGSEGSTSTRLTAPPRAHARISPNPPGFMYAVRMHPGCPSLVLTGSFDGGVRAWDVRMGEVNVGGGRGGAAPPMEARFLGFLEGSDPRAPPRPSSLPPLGASARSLTASAATTPPFYVNCLEFDAAAYLSGIPKQLITGDSNGCLRFYTCGSIGGGGGAGSKVGGGVGVGGASRPSLTTTTTTTTTPLALTRESFALVKELRPPMLRGVPIVSIRTRPVIGSHGHPQVCVLGQGNVLRLFDAITFASLRAFPAVRCIDSRLEAAWDPTGTLLAAGSEDGALCVWDADTGAPLPTRASLAGGGGSNSPGGSASSGDGSSIAIGFPSKLTSLAWSPTTHTLACVGFGAAYPVMVVT